MIKHTLYANGTIRNAAGRLVGFFDSEASTLVLDGHVQVYKVADAAHAMDLVGAYVV